MYQNYHATGNNRTKTTVTTGKFQKNERQNIYSMLLENSSLLSEKQQKMQSKAKLL